jgi:hypothetical protein
MAFKGLSLTQVFSITLVIAAILTVVSYFRYHETIKYQESKLTTWEKIKVYLIRFIHYSVLTFAWIYPITAKILFFNDFILGLLIIIAHFYRIYFKECVLSKIEKQILNINYVAGSNPKYEPFWYLFDFPSHIMQNIENKLNFIPVVVLLFRLFYSYNK